MKNISSLSYIRAISCIAVVILHTFLTSSGYASAGGFISDTQLITANTTRNLMMWAVPCFVMVSGRLLLDTERNVTYRKIFTGYIPRILSALLVFSLLFAVYDSLTKDGGLTLSAVLDGIKSCFTDGSWGHMWYLYLMTALYIMLPFFRMVSVSLKKSDCCYLLAVYVIFLSVIPLINNFSKENIAFYICTYTVYPLYFFGGYIIGKKKISLSPIIWGTLFALGTATVIILSVIAEKNKFEILSKQFKSYSFLPVVLQSFGLFGLMASFDKQYSKVLHKILTEIDSCSFGIYLIHLMFLKTVIAYCNWNPYKYDGTLTALLLALAVTLISYAVIRILKFVPYVNRIL